MDNTQLRDVELISQESPGALILSTVWNQNFNRFREVVNENNATTKANFDKINARTVPAEALELLGQTDASNIMEQLILISTILNTKANSSDVAGEFNNFYNDIKYDKSTGTFTFTKKDGTVLEVDTLLEKMPVSAELISTEDDVFLRITNDDGSYTETPVSDLVSDYDFLSTNTIACTVSSKDSNFKLYEVAFEIKPHSISEEYLDPAVLSFITDATVNINSLLESARTAATSAFTSASEANEYKNASALSATEAKEGAEDAVEAALLSKSYAQGGTGVRTNEDYDNAKYWAEVAKIAASQADVNFVVSDIEPEINNCIWFNISSEYQEAAAEVLNLDEDESGYDYFVETDDGEVYGIENVAETTDQLTDTNYNFTII